MSGTAPAEAPRAALPPLAGLLALVAVTLLAYWAALGAGTVWDDDSYLTANPLLTEPGGLARIWLAPRASPQYYPLVFTSFWLERRLFGLEPFGYHLVNVLLHGASAWLLWRLLVRLAVPGALLAALLFALHPVHVESVAWITERKNVLSMLLALAAARAYLAFRPLAPERTRGSPGLYVASLLLFAGALLSKSVTGILPFALGIVTWWKRGRVGWRDLLPLVPFVLLAVPLGLHTALLEREHVGAAGLEWDFTFPERVLLAGRAFWFYVGKVLWPHPLIFFYPRVLPDPAEPWPWVLAALVVVLFAALFLLRGRLGRGPLAAFLLFGIGIGPASGFFDVYPQRYSFVADHFQYHAAYALLVLLAAGAALLTRRFPTRVRHAGAALGCIVLGLATRAHTQAFADEETLWRDTLAKNETSWAAHSHLGYIALERGQDAEGRALLVRAAELCPFPSEAWVDAANIHAEAGDMDRALALFGPVLAARPVALARLVDTARLLGQRGRTDDALRLSALAAQTLPASAPARVTHGNALSAAGRHAQAEEEFLAALALAPDDAEAHFGLGSARARLGRYAEAAEAFAAALAARPDWERARRALEEARRRGG